MECRHRSFLAPECSRRAQEGGFERAPCDPTGDCRGPIRPRPGASRPEVARVRRDPAASLHGRAPRRRLRLRAPSTVHHAAAGTRRGVRPRGRTVRAEASTGEAAGLRAAARGPTAGGASSHETRADPLRCFEPRARIDRKGARLQCPPCTTPPTSACSPVRAWSRTCSAGSPPRGGAKRSTSRRWRSSRRSS